MAVGLERAHAQCLREGKSLLVVSYGVLDLRRLAPRRNLAQEPQGPRLVPPFLLGTREGQGTRGAYAGLLPAASQEIGLAQPGDKERLVVQESRAVGFRQRLLQQRQRLGDTP